MSCSNALLECHCSYLHQGRQEAQRRASKRPARTRTAPVATPPQTTPTASPATPATKRCHTAPLCARGYHRALGTGQHRPASTPPVAGLSASRGTTPLAAIDMPTQCAASSFCQDTINMFERVPQRQPTLTCRSHTRRAQLIRTWRIEAHMYYVIVGTLPL